MNRVLASMRKVLGASWPSLLIVFGLLISNVTPALAMSKDDRSALLRGTELFDPKDGCKTVDLSNATGGDPVCKGPRYPNVTDPDAFAKTIDTYIRATTPKSPLAGLGYVFVQQGKNYGVNPALMVAIAQQESTLGTAGVADDGGYNPFGNSYAGANDRCWKSPPAPFVVGKLNDGKRDWNKYNSWQDGIAWQASYLKCRFFDQGLTKLIDIIKVYAPSSDGNDPTGYTSNIGKTITKIVDAAGTSVACGVSSPTITSSGNVKAGSVFMVGDSISNRIKNQLTANFKDSGWSINIDATDGRPLNGANAAFPTANLPDVMTVIANNSALIQSAVAVVVELGTNPGDQSDFTTQINTTIDKIRAINPSVPIYWVNIGSSGDVFGPSDTAATKSTAMFSKRNKDLSSAGTQKNFGVINWAGEVFPSKDITNIQPLQESNANLLDTDKVHPNIAGTKALADLVSTNVSAGTLKTSSGTGGACDDSRVGTAAVAGANGYDIGTNGLVYYNQGDPPWNVKKYGNNTIQACGCGPTSLAMIIATLTGDKSVNPSVVADYIMQNTPQYISGGCGSVQDVAQVVTHWGLKARSLGTSMDAAIKTVRSGGLVFLNVVKGSGGNAVRASAGGHFVVIRKVSDDGQTLYVANSGWREDNNVAFKISDVAAQLQAGGSPLYGITR